MGNIEHPAFGDTDSPGVLGDMNTPVLEAGVIIHPALGDVPFPSFGDIPYPGGAIGDTPTPGGITGESNNPVLFGVIIQPAAIFNSATCLPA